MSQVLYPGLSSGMSIEQRLSALGLLDVANDVALEHGVSRSELLGRRRFADLACARKRLYVELRLRGLSYPVIGGLLDRDHTTVLYACQEYGL